MVYLEKQTIIFEVPQHKELDGTGRTRAVKFFFPLRV